MAQRLRIGLAGFGAVTRQLIPSIQAMPNAELTAIAAPRQESRDEAAQRHGVATFASVEELCASPEVDAVWVCTPNSLHAEHAITAAEHGKHVINEKPMAVTLAEADAIIEAVRRNGVRYVQGHSKLFDPPVRRMREVVSTGELGRIIQINTWEFKPWITGAPRRDEDVDTSRGGGVVFRQGPHQADVVRGIGGGMVSSLRAVAGRWHPGFPLGEGDYTAFVEFDDGAAATMAFNGYGFFDVTELTWGIGEGGQQRDLAALQAGAQNVAPLPKRQPFYGLTIVSCEHGDIRQSPDGLFVYTQNGRQEIPVEQRGPGRPEIDELCEAIEQGRPTFPGEEWGLASLEVVLAILQSSAERREVPLHRQVSCPF